MITKCNFHHCFFQALLKCVITTGLILAKKRYWSQLKAGIFSKKCIPASAITPVFFEKYPQTSTFDPIFSKIYPQTCAIDPIFSKKWPPTSAIGYVFSKKWPRLNAIGGIISKKWPSTHCAKPLLLLGYSLFFQYSDKKFSNICLWANRKVK